MQELGTTVTLLDRGSSAHIVDCSELIRMHRRQVLRIGLRITKNRNDVQDAQQDSFMRVLFHLRRFQGKAQIGKPSLAETVLRRQSAMCALATHK